ncbi:guanine nucleotide-binding protein-like 1 [Paramacrobiotus metropolitanus]|uniref:guanine nucleotide-binding protein-like 1 n=1 Tax=Paramacrobiotus metropolitanus TaxID=2943436 RepID=UPI0024462C49|nr:guanine nucleotide-binding protein-like 1 [Paramacrobiotus metropolitanus]
MGQKVVSVSKTPGHTKHFQTIFLAPNVKLCDCPGLVFPATAPKVLQIIGGIYPISQVSDPYSVIGYLAAHLPLIQLLKLKHPKGESAKFSPLDICEAWALKRGFFTAKAARPDVYRAGIHLLRIMLEGKICLRTYPPGYVEKKKHFENFGETKQFASELEQLEQKLHGVAKNDAVLTFKDYEDVCAYMLRTAPVPPDYHPVLSLKQFLFIIGCFIFVLILIFHPKPLLLLFTTLLRLGLTV